MANDLFRRNVEVLAADSIELERPCKAVGDAGGTATFVDSHGRDPGRDHDLGYERR